MSDDAKKMIETIDSAATGATPTADSHLNGLFAGRYRIEKLLGRGGMGAVYSVLDTMVGDVVALKTLDLGVAPNEATIERFRREVRLARRITHPNVARTHDLGEANGQHYLTMELVDGTDLQSVLERELKLDAERAARIALSIADGLGAAHAAGVVHRDLKPANVLVDRIGRVVLTDFGIARAVVDEAAMYRTAGTVGTPLYMAPEQVTGGKIDARTDVYALGLVLFEMLTGECAFVGDTPIATALARLEHNAPDPRTLTPLDDELAGIVITCLARDAARRPSDGAAAAQLLRMWLVTHGNSIADVDGGAATQAFAPLLSSMSTNILAPSALGITPTSGPSTPPTGGSSTPRSAASIGVLGSKVRALAVLPFRYRGAVDQEYLGEALADDLIDLLSRTRGLRVLGSGATARYKDERDPRKVGVDLGVDAVVDATVQASGTLLRVTARLVDVESGTQLWNERFDGSLEDVFELQDSISKRIAEALRVSLAAGAPRADAPTEAVESYLRGRRALSQLKYVGEGGAVPLFEHALELAPGFQPAVAAHAMATVRTWFLPDLDNTRDWAATATASVERALLEAPELAETHQARAMFAMQLGRFREAAQALTRALEIAPTFGEAHQSLGSLLVEAGRVDQGLKHLRLAVQLDPSQRFALLTIARTYALGGDLQRYRAVIGQLDPLDFAASVMLAMRVATWFRDFDEVRVMIAKVADSSLPIARFAALYGRAVLGEIPADSLAKMLDSAVRGPLSPRFVALASQTGCEICSVIGDIDNAETHLQRAVECGLIDLEWMDKCPVLAELRTRPSYAELRRTVRGRADEIWQATTVG